MFQRKIHLVGFFAIFLGGIILVWYVLQPNKENKEDVNVSNFSWTVNVYEDKGIYTYTYTLDTPGDAIKEFSIERKPDFTNQDMLEGSDDSYLGYVVKNNIDDNYYQARFMHAFHYAHIIDNQVKIITKRPPRWGSYFAETKNGGSNTNRSFLTNPPEFKGVDVNISNNYIIVPN